MFGRVVAYLKSWSKSPCATSAPRVQSVLQLGHLSSEERVRALIRDHPNHRNMYIYSLSNVEQSYRQWHAEFSGITPYYAVKCNPSSGLISKLAALGAHFDCASPREIECVLKQGVPASKIIYANPCKHPDDIAFAVQRGVRFMTFDSIYELDKFKPYRDLPLALRIYASDPAAQCQLSNKYGAPRVDWVPMLIRAKALGLNVMGVSFHVGSGASTASSFEEAIEMSRSFCDLAALYGFQVTTVDVGGGFVYGKTGEISAVVRETLRRCFPEDRYTFIAEPGRYFAETSAMLVSKVIGKRESSAQKHYWIADGIYGSFNCMLYDHVDPTTLFKGVHRLDASATNEQTYASTIFGPTCDGLDKVMDIGLPDLCIGDYIVFDRMGAYTVAGASHFNGIPFPETPKFYVA